MQTPGKCALHFSKQKLIMEHSAGAELMIDKISDKI